MSRTPGPFSVRRAVTPQDGEYDYCVSAEIEGRQQVVAEVFGRTSETHRPDAYSNAHLFAAAPDLLKALKCVRDFLDEHKLPMGVFARSLMTDAIKKAGG